MRLWQSKGLTGAARLLGAGRVRRFARRVRARLAPPALILMYHRVAEVPLDPWGLCVSPRHFSEQIDVLRRTCTLLPLSQMVELLRAGKRLPRRALAITFDDGYADNLHRAQPLLARYGLPATFFITTGLWGQGREFWWDELERILLQTGPLPEKLTLKIGGEVHTWALPTPRASSAGRSWRAWGEAPGPYHALYCALWKLLRKAQPQDREQAFIALRTWAGTSPEARLTHRLLSREEVRALAEKPGVEIGAHTVSHPALPFLPAEVQYREMVEGKAQLEALLGRAVSGFSYPNGLHSDETIALVREAGFAWACSVGNEVVMKRGSRGASVPLLALPRVQVMDDDGEAFERQLRAWWATPA